MARTAEELITKMTADAKGFLAGVSKADKSVKTFEKTNAIVGKKISTIWKAVISAAVVVAAVKITKAIIKIGKDLTVLGQKSLSLKRSFKSLAEAAGTSSAKLLVDMKIATRGTIAEIDLLSAANRMMLLGLDVSIFDEVMEIARRTAKATGMDINYMVESLSMGLGRQSKMILDNLGIVFQTSEAYEWYAKTLGKTSAQLTENEKRIGFQTYAMKVARENVEKLGEDTLTLTEVGAVFVSEWKDLKAFIGERLVEAIGKVIEKFGGWEVVMEDVHFWVDEKVKPAVIGLVNKIIEFAKECVKAGKKISAKFRIPLDTLAGTIKTEVVPAFKALIDRIVPSIPQILKFISGLADLSVKWLPKIVKKIGELIKMFTNLDPKWKEAIFSTVKLAAVTIPALIVIGRISAAITGLVAVGGSIVAIFVKFGGIIAKIKGVLETLYIVLLGITAPIAIAIAAILALIGTILLWVKYGEASRKKTIEIWGAIWNFLVNLWVTIGEKAVGIWNSIRDFFVNLWKSIKTKAVEIWDSIREIFVNFWEGIKESFQNARDEIVTRSNEMWEEIKNIFVKAGEDIWAWMLDWIPFLNLYVEALEWSKELTRQILGKVKEFFIETWNTIKDFCIETWNTIKDKTIEVWESIKEFFIETWETIKIKATEIWNSVKEFFILLWEDIKFKVIEVWNSVKDFFVEIWEGIKETFEIALNWIKDTITIAFNWLRDSVIIPVWSSVVSFFRGIWNNILIAVNTFAGNFLRVWNSIKEGLKSPINAMIGLINNFLSRVQSAMSGMISALNRIGFRVPDWFAKIIPALAGREFKISIPKISIPRIPKLEFGGIIPKTQRIMAHGGEMMLTRADQRNLFNLIRQPRDSGVRGKTEIHIHNEYNEKLASETFARLFAQKVGDLA